VLGRWWYDAGRITLRTACDARRAAVCITVIDATATALVSVTIGRRADSGR